MPVASTTRWSMSKASASHRIAAKACRQSPGASQSCAKSLVESTDPGLTQNTTGPMTPQYAAPEQFHGSTLTVATDVYQFGVLMFHVLTGRLPLRADPRDPVAWAHAVAEEEPLSLTRALHLTTTEESADGERRAWASGTR